MDIITYVPDSAALVTELQEKFPDLVSQADPTTGSVGGKFLVDKTPTVRNAEGESLALVRGDATLLAVAEELDSLVALGTYDDVFATPELKEIYDRVYPRTPVVWTDPEGTEHTTIPPEMFGVFAS